MAENTVMAEGEVYGFPTVDVKLFLQRIEEEFIDDVTAQKEYDAAVAAGQTPAQPKRIPFPVLGLGKAGIGKTEGVAGLCASHGWGFKEMRLVNYTETDLIGIPYKNDQGMTDHATNVIFPNEARDGKYGILLVDEFTSAPSNIQVPILQLTDSSRSVGNYHLPDGWKIVLAGNGIHDGGTFRSLPGTVISRASCYYVEASVPSWLDWATANGVHSTIRAFIKANPSELHGYREADEDADCDKAFPCPRTWTKLNRFLCDLDRRYPDWLTGKSLEADYLLILVSSNVGITTGQRFCDFTAYNKDTEDPERILSGTKPLKKLSDMKTAVAYLTLTMLSDRLHSEVMKPGVVDLVNFKFSPKVFQLYANACNWIFDGVPSPTSELATFGIADLNSTNSSTAATIVNSKEFLDLCPRYKQCVAGLRGVYRS